MGVVLPLKRSGPQDWTASERAWLEALVDHLTAGEGGLTLEFGRSDVGDPWCVLTDGRDETLLHAARIKGQVVVHHAPEDVLTEDDDLREALRRVFGPEWLAPSPATVHAFAGLPATASAVVALIVLGWLDSRTGLFSETSDDGAPPLTDPSTGEHLEDGAPVRSSGSPSSEATGSGELGPGATSPTPVETASLPAPQTSDSRAAPALRTTDPVTERASDEPAPQPAPPVSPASGEIADFRGGGDFTAEVAIARVLLEPGGHAYGGPSADVFVVPAGADPEGNGLLDLGLLTGFDPVLDRFETAGGAPVRFFADTPDRIRLDLDGDGESDAVIRLVADTGPAWTLLGDPPG